MIRDSELVNGKIRLDGCSESNRLYLVPGVLFLESLTVTDVAVPVSFPMAAGVDSLWYIGGDPTRAEPRYGTTALRGKKKDVGREKGKL